MKVFIGEARGGPLVSSALMVGAIGLLGVTVWTNFALQTTAPIIAVAVTALIAYRRLLSWPALIALILLVILFVPMKRYSLPSSLPFHLEPYRLIVAFVLVGWLASLLIDPRVNFKRTLLDKPLTLFIFAALFSLIFNKARVNSVSPDVVKKLVFFASFILVLYLVASSIRRYRDVDFLVRVLVGGGSVVAVFSVIEARTGYNVFNHLNSFLPYLKGNNFAKLAATANRGARLRVFASSQHPIALGAALMMLVPLAVYLARSHGTKRWWFAAGLLVLGSLATVSRTAVVMMLVMIMIFIWLRPQEMKRLWPLILPALLLIHFAIPGTLGTLRASFFPRGGLVSQQTHQRVGSGRLATLGPALHTEFRPNPLLGEGFGTRVSVADENVPVPNGPILDNQWLGTLLETGVVGALSFAWIFLRFVRRLGRAAKDDPSPRGWLLAGFAASVGAFGVGMFFYDAFAFIQVTFMLFIFLGLGIATLRTPPGSGPVLRDAAVS
jgi:hypothetical protein